MLALYASGGLVGVFADAGGRSGAVRCQLSVLDRTAVSCQLYSPGGSVRCSQMPRGLVTIVRSSGGLVRVFADARGGVGGTISN